MTTEAWDWIKIIAALAGGGAMGSLITAIITNQRNKIQPIGRRVIVSYIDLPTIMRGYTAQVSIKGNEVEESGAHLFEQLAIVQIYLINKGNKDIERFDLGVNISEENTVIGVQRSSIDRYHTSEYSPKVSITNPVSEIDFVLKPFNRRDQYKLTLVVNAANKDLKEKVSLSKSLPVKFVDIEVKKIAIEKKRLIAMGFITLFTFPASALVLLINKTYFNMIFLGLTVLVSLLVIMIVRFIAFYY